MRRATHLLVALTFGVASACGSTGDGAAAEDAAAEAAASAAAETTAVEAAVVQGLEQRASAGSDVLVTAEQRRCAGEGIVDALGPARLRTLGVGDDSEPLERLRFTEDDLERMGAALDSCVVASDIVVDLLAYLYPPESVECLLDELPASFIHRTVAAAAIGLDPIAYESFFETLLDAEAACPPS